MTAHQGLGVNFRPMMRRCSALPGSVATWFPKNGLLHFPASATKPIQFCRHARRVCAVAPPPARSFSTSPPLQGRPIRWQPGPYDSVVIDASTVQSSEASLFVEQLGSLVQEWRGARRGAVWIELRATQGALIEGVASAGFTFHHATGQTCSMLLWLQNRPCPVPSFATHHIGVGGIVFDDDRRVLVVKDRQARAPQPWKFPGGLANLGESFGDAAAREVVEETGIRAEMRSVLAVRHMHGLAFGNSDLYVFCHMRALSTEICIDPVEILDARWMGVSEFLESVRHPLSRYAVQRACRELDGAPDAGSSWVQEDVLIPSLGKTVVVYRPAAGGPVHEQTARDSEAALSGIAKSAPA